MVESDDFKHSNDNNSENWWKLIEQSDIMPKVDVRQTAHVRPVLRDARDIYLIYKELSVV